MTNGIEDAPELPKPLTREEVLGPLENDPVGGMLKANLEWMFGVKEVVVYRKDKNLINLIEHERQKWMGSFPLIDKATRRVYVVGGGQHVILRASLYGYTMAKRNKTELDETMDVDEAADKYIREGMGYYFSGADSRLTRAAANMVYGEKYVPDKNDKPVFDIYAERGQMMSDD